MHKWTFGLFLVALVVTASLVPLAGAEDFQPEAGFTLLFNGNNLDGWRTKKGGVALTGQMEAFKGRFKVTDGHLVIDPKVKGDVVIETAKELSKDVHIKFDFLPGPGCNNDLFFRGQKFDLTKKLKSFKEGEWNQFEIIAHGNKVEFKCNGTVERTANVKVPSSTLGVRAEFGPVQFRRIRVKEMP